MITEFAFTAYRVTDMAAARKFYEEQLGLTLALNHQDRWVEYGIGGATFAVQTMTPEPPNGNRGTVAFEVDDLDAMVAGLKARGVPMVSENIESPVCRMAVVHDPDGNPVVLHKRKA